MGGQKIIGIKRSSLSAVTNFTMPARASGAFFLLTGELLDQFQSGTGTAMSGGEQWSFSMN
jgi:hypothetical protein